MNQGRRLLQELRSVTWRLPTQTLWIATTAFLCAWAIGTGPALALESRLLNVSYDVSREFYKDYNAAFAAHWKKTTGAALTLNQSHGGSSRQARSVGSRHDPDRRGLSGGRGSDDACPGLEGPGRAAVRAQERNFVAGG